MRASVTHAIRDTLSAMTDTPESEAKLPDLAEMIDREDRQGCVSFVRDVDSTDVLPAVSRLDEEDRTRLLAMLEPEEAADLIERLPESQAVEAIEDLAPVAAARIIEELPSDAQADIIGDMDAESAGAIIDELHPDDADDVRLLTTYADDVAGGLMVTEYLSYTTEDTVADVIRDLGEHAEEYADYDIQYAYVSDDERRLAGVLRMRDLLLTPRSRHLRDIMITSPHAVTDDETLENLVQFFEDHGFFGVPVVDADGVLCGVVRRSAVEAAIAQDQERLYRVSQGIVGGEELRTMSLLLRSRRRLSWLSVNIGLNIVAASVIAMHQDTLEAVIALAVFLPIISDMSGCSGNQAVAVSMRELTLGVIKPTEIWRTIWAELSLGVVNGFVLGVLIGAVALLWKSNVYLGLVVGGALMLNTIVAVIIGGSVPLLLKRMKVDPALAAGPILTTITDMCGFFIVLTFAAMMLSRLT